MKELRRLIYLLLNLFLCYCTFGNKYGYNNLIITNYDKSKMTFRIQMVIKEVTESCLLLTCPEISGHPMACRLNARN